MSQDAADAYLRDIGKTFRNYKTLAERAIAQVPDPALHTELDANSNSIAVIVKHVGGNLKSRFRDFLTSDGEKPGRHRDSEFEMTDAVGRETVLGWWNEGWGIALASIEALQAADLSRTISIRGEV